MENSSIQFDPARLPELFEMISQLNASQNESDVIQRALDSALRLMNAEYAFLQLINSHEVHIAPTPNQGFAEFFSSISESLATHMAQARASISVSDWQEFSTFANEHLPGFLASHATAIATLKTSRAEVGTLAVTRDISTGAFTPDEISALELFANWAALALDATQVSKTREACANFVHGACFDIRSELTAIMGYSQLLRDGLSSVAIDEQLEMIDLLNNLARKASTLTTVLPDLARIEFGTFRFRLAPIDAAKCIRQIVEELGPQLEAQRHLLKVFQPASIPLVMAEERRFHQVLTGLISNADQFMLQEGQITITAVIEDKVVCISVSDNGIGIPPNEQPQVFSKWFHANVPVELRHLQGIGSSLYIFKHVVEGMGGTIGFESEPGKGSTFWFTLPIAEQDVSVAT